MTTTIIHKDYPGISRDVRSKPLDPQLHYAACSPFDIFTHDSIIEISGFGANALSVEESKYNSRSNADLRKNSLVRPGIPNIGQTVQGFSQVDVTSLTAGRPIISERYRERDYAGVPVTTVLYFACTYLAYSPDRDSLFRTISYGSAIPTYLTQLSQKVRQTRIPTAHVFVNGHVETLPLEVKAKLLNTIMDADFVTSPVGFKQFISFCNWLSQSEGNYIAFSILNETNYSKLLPSLEGGHQCTFCALNTRPYQSDSLEKLVELRPSNAFASAIPVVHFDDAVVVGQSLYSNVNNVAQYPFVKENFSQIVQFSSDSDVLRYIMERMTNNISNTNPALPAPVVKQRGNQAASQQMTDPVSGFIDNLLGFLNHYRQHGNANGFAT